MHPPASEQTRPSQFIFLPLGYLSGKVMSGKLYRAAGACQMQMILFVTAGKGEAERETAQSCAWYTGTWSMWWSWPLPLASLCLHSPPSETALWVVT